MSCPRDVVVDVFGSSPFSMHPVVSPYGLSHTPSRRGVLGNRERIGFVLRGRPSDEVGRLCRTGTGSSGSRPHHLHLHLSEQRVVPHPQQLELVHLREWSHQYRRSDVQSHRQGGHVSVLEGYRWGVPRGPRREV